MEAPVFDTKPDRLPDPVEIARVALRNDREGAAPNTGKLRA